MNAHRNDRELLRSYAEHGSEEDFTELVQRRFDFVFSVALREVNEAQSAADIAQAAFILLARKAGSIPARESLSGWLFQTVRYLARNSRRAAWRREHYEKEASRMNTPGPADESEPAWERLAPLLNDALASLSAGDRDVVTLRFFEKKSHGDIAMSIGVPEASVRKRLSRAVERLRRSCARRGVAVTGASLAAALMAQSVAAAPSGLAGAVATVALAKGAGASASVGALVHGGLQALTLAKLKLAGVAAAAVAALMLGGFVFKWAERAPDEGRAGFQLVDLQFTNRLVERDWGGDIVTPGGRPHLFIRTRLDGKPLGTITRLLAPASGGTTVPTPVLLQVADERGDSIEGTFLRRGSVTGTTHSHLWEVSFFPRRGSNLWLRLFDRQWNRLAEFRVANPSLASVTQLAPVALPGTGSDGNLTVQLDEFNRGPQDAAAPAGGTGVDPRRVTTITYRLREANRAAESWLLRSIRVNDATGNSWQESRPATVPLPGADGRFQTRLYHGLWAGEPAWELEMEFMRTDHFAAEEVLALPALSVPPTNQTIPLQQDYELNGERVRLISLSGPQRGFDGDPQQPPGHLVLQLELPTLGDFWRPGLFDVRDEQSRPWSVPHYQRNGTRVRFHLHGPAGAQRLTMKLVRQELRRVRFVARLSDSSPNSTPIR